MNYKLLVEIGSMAMAIVVAYLLSFYRAKGSVWRQVCSAPKIQGTEVILGSMFLLLPLFSNWTIALSSEILEYEILGIIVNAERVFNNVTIWLWVFSLKLMLFSTLLALFFKIESWWRYSLLVPVVLTTFQMRTLFFPNVDEVIDEYEIFEALPLLLLVLVLLLYLSRSAYYQSRLKRLYRATAFRIQENKESLSGDRLNYLRQKWEDITRFKSNNTSVSELKNLRKELERQLEEY